MRERRSAAQIWPPVMLATITGILIAAWLFGLSDIYHRLVGMLMSEPFAFPFLDTHVFLAWAECHGKGIDIYETNPCDALDRTLAQSPLWLSLSHVGANVGWTDIAGTVIDAMFVACLFTLPQARTGRDAVIWFLALCSPVVFYAVERANTDLIVFVPVMLAARLAARPQPGARLAGYALVTLASLLKYYPLAALALALREQVPRVIAIGVAVLAVGGTFVLIHAADLPRTTVIRGYWLGANFGAVNLLSGLRKLGPNSPIATNTISICFGLLSILAAVWYYCRTDLRQRLRTLTEEERNTLLVGCSIIAGSFVMFSNGPYRAVFLLPVVAVGMRLRAETGGAPHTIVVLVCLAVMWGSRLPELRPENDQRGAWFLVNWLAWQAAWWWLFGVLVAILLALVKDTPLLTPISRLLSRRTG